MMSNIIPMVSSSPPPMDEGGGFGWDDVGDEFSTFASAGDSSFADTGHDKEDTASFDNANSDHNMDESASPSDSDFADFVSFPTDNNVSNSVPNNYTNTDNEGEVDQRPESINFQKDITTEVTQSVSIATQEDVGEVTVRVFTDSGVYSSNVSPVQQVDTTKSENGNHSTTNGKLDVTENTDSNRETRNYEELFDATNMESAAVETDEIGTDFVIDTSPSSDTDEENCDKLYLKNNIPYNCIPSNEEADPPTHCQSRVDNDSLKDSGVSIIDAEPTQSSNIIDKPSELTDEDIDQNTSDDLHSNSDNDNNSENRKHFEHVDAIVHSEEEDGVVNECDVEATQVIERSTVLLNDEKISCENSISETKDINDALKTKATEDVHEKCDNQDMMETEVTKCEAMAENEPKTESAECAIPEISDSTSESEVTFQSEAAKELEERDSKKVQDEGENDDVIHSERSEMTNDAVKDELDNHSKVLPESTITVKQACEKTTDDFDNFTSFNQTDQDHGDGDEFGDFNASFGETTETGKASDEFAPFSDTQTTGSVDLAGNYNTGSEWAAFSSPGGTEIKAEQVCGADDWAAFSQLSVTAESENAKDDATDDWGDFDDEVPITTTQEQEMTPSSPVKLTADKLPATTLQNMSKHEKLIYAVESCFSGSFCETDISDSSQLNSDIFLDNCSTVWQEMQGTTNALTYQWTKSKWNTQLFCTLQVDTRNILIGHKKASSMPVFAAGLTLLEPTKGQAIIIKPDILVDTSKTDLAPTPQESIPAAQFDWSSSGLTNPLEANNKSLNLDFLIQEQATKSTELESEFLSASSDVPIHKPAIQPLENILANMKTTSTYVPTNLQQDISQEASKILHSLPDLLFMKSKVLMFPMKMDG